MSIRAQLRQRVQQRCIKRLTYSLLEPFGLMLEIDAADRARERSGRDRKLRREARIQRDNLRSAPHSFQIAGPQGMRKDAMANLLMDTVRGSPNRNHFGARLNERFWGMGSAVNLIRLRIGTVLAVVTSAIITSMVKSVGENAPAV